MDTYDAVIVYIAGIISGVIGCVFYKGWYVRKAAKMDEPWKREIRHIQLRDDRRIQ